MHVRQGRELINTCSVGTEIFETQFLNFITDIVTECKRRTLTEQ